MSAKAYYHLPGLFEFYEFYRAFLPLYRAIVTGFMTGVRLGPFTAHRRTASGEADERVSVSAAHAKRWLWHRSTAFPRG